MGLISVDVSRCEKDGACVEVCPISLLMLDPERGPRVRPGYGQYCIGCGHCVAVCPHGALDNVRNPLAGQSPLSGYTPPAPEEAFAFLRSRRSIRRYQGRPVPRATLLELLRIARYSPSGHNSQGLSFMVVDNAEAIRTIGAMVVEWMRQLVATGSELSKVYNLPGIIKACERGEDRILRGASAVIVAMAPKSIRAATASTVLALEYVELYAPSLGLGTCWAGFAQFCAQQHPALPEFLKVPEEKAVTGILMVGYPQYAYHRLPERNPLDVTWFGED